MADTTTGFLCFYFWVFFLGVWGTFLIGLVTPNGKINRVGRCSRAEEIFGFRKRERKGEVKPYLSSGTRLAVAVGVRLVSGRIGTGRRRVGDGQTAIGTTESRQTGTEGAARLGILVMARVPRTIGARWTGRMIVSGGTDAAAAHHAPFTVRRPAVGRSESVWRLRLLLLLLLLRMCRRWSARRMKHPYGRAGFGQLHLIIGRQVGMGGAWRRHGRRGGCCRHDIRSSYPRHPDSFFRPIRFYVFFFLGGLVGPELGV